MANKKGSKKKQGKTQSAKKSFIGSVAMQKKATPNTSFKAPPGSVAAPTSYFKERKSYFKIVGGDGDSIRIRGCDFLASLGWIPSQVAGTSLQNVLICPGAGALVNTRLGKFANLYEKYVFKRLTFHCQSACASSQTGAYILSYDRDVSDPTPPANADAIRQYLAHDGARAGACWESISIDCPLSDTQDFYYTNPVAGGDERLVYQGQLYMAVMTPISSNQNMNLWVEYELVLMDPQLENNVVESKMTANTGNCNTTASGAWNTLVTTAVANPIVPFVLNAAGNRGINIPPGTWLLEQALSLGSAGGQTISPSNVIDALTGADVTSSVLSALDTVYTVATSFAGAGAWRSEKIVNPGPDNVIAFGNFTGPAGQVIANQMVRILEMTGTQIL